jgi:phosphate transport system protein
MSKHLEADLARIKRLVLSMGALVEEALHQGTRSVLEHDEDRARATLEVDSRIDALELEVDEQCLKCLALNQPVAGDLRFITAAMKIATGLERIGDLAGNIAKRSLKRLDGRSVDLDLGFDPMVEVVRSMLHDVLDAFVTANAELAREVCARDDDVDERHKRNLKALIAHMGEHPGDVPECVSLLTVTRSLERIADHTTNIAQDVVFLVEAVDIRHPGLSAG